MPRRSRGRSDEEPARRASQLYRSIWGVVARIPRGRVATYGQIAALAGHPCQPRLAGYALYSIPAGLSIPWHRVVNARGEISVRSGSFPDGETSLQRALLEREGIQFSARGACDLSRYRWRPRPDSPRRPSAARRTESPGSPRRRRRSFL
ncbi:MAG: methylated-DNA--[protein]-cysteine S-methyltransferase [Candidatus Eisenbacteria bacterium]|nr:methylated-DNA--[protein]-cysteine S-methyltransferase [Candidatus Eisenbacteria bacterium]